MVAESAFRDQPIKKLKEDPLKINSLPTFKPGAIQLDKPKRLTTCTNGECALESVVQVPTRPHRHHQEGCVEPRRDCVRLWLTRLKFEQKGTWRQHMAINKQKHIKAEYGRNILKHWTATSSEWHETAVNGIEEQQIVTEGSCRRRRFKHWSQV